jgi:hypothetical protein
MDRTSARAPAVAFPHRRRPVYRLNLKTGKWRSKSRLPPVLSNFTLPQKSATTPRSEQQRIRAQSCVLAQRQLDAAGAFLAQPPLESPQKEDPRAKTASISNQNDEWSRRYQSSVCTTRTETSSARFEYESDESSRTAQSPLSPSEYRETSSVSIAWTSPTPARHSRSKDNRKSLYKETMTSANP